MNEEAVNLIFDWVKGRGYQGSKEEWLNYIQTNDDAFNYIYEIAKTRGYQKDENAFGTLMGRTAPVATTTPTKTEPTTPIATAPTTPPVATAPVATTEPATTAPVAETKPTVTPEPTKELRSEPMTTVKAQALPEKQVTTPTVDMAKMPTMEVKSVEATPIKEEPMTAEKQEVVKSDIESQLLPITEKTEVKAIETPSDKMVIKSETKVEEPKVEVKPTEVAKVEVKEMKTEQPKMKVKGKLKTEPIKIETIKVESEKGPTTVDVPSFAVPEPRKKYKPYGEKGPDVYYSEDNDQYIIKEGDNRTVVNKGSGKYEEIDKKIGETVKSVKEGEGKCDPEEGGSCSINNIALGNYLYYNKDDFEHGWRSSYEAALSKELDNRKRFFEDNGESLWSAYHNDEKETTKSFGNLLYGGEEPPKSDRFITYKPFGNDQTLVYDKGSGIILKQLNDKAPVIEDVLTKGKENIRKYYQDYKKQNPNEGLKLWQAIEIDNPEYKELKSIIEGVNYKKEKGVKNTYVAPTISTGIPVTEWSQVKEVPAVSDKMVIKSEAKVEPKPVEEVKGIPSYDDLGINTEKDPGDFLGANFDKNTKFEKMSPSELIEKGVFTGDRSNIKLERNKSLRYPDPPGTVFKKEKVGDKEYYSSYDETNNKWYIYDENSSKDSWTEVKKGPIETLLFSKFFEGSNAYLNERGRPIQSKEDYNSEEEDKKIGKIKEGILLNKYLPYIMKNYDNLSDEQKTKLKKDLNKSSYNILLRKYLEPNDPNLDFWLDINDKFFQNQSTYSNAIDVYGEGNRDKYKEEEMEVPKINKDIEEGRLKLLKSVAGEVLYDEKNDVFYYGPSQRDLKITKRQLWAGDGSTPREATNVAYVKILPKGTPAYDKIKSSLSKYNK